MSYTVLARRYRSQSFGAVVGQEPIAQTLRNAIGGARTHHAYLFSGTRGVGKTSMARIFARALNAPATIDDCPAPPDAADYPPEDVQQRMAEAIMRGEDLNVIEIDAASNTGVDNVRDIIANASLAPTDSARYKVYIIDEVHMLSRAAFNALLKIMEEPPRHVKFILCTTQPEDVPPTIQSRCQRFDFRHIPTGRIAEHLTAVLEREGIGADPAVIHQVARMGNGSMRDALSLLDRLLASGEDPLTADLLERMLGLPDRQLIGAIVEAIIAGQISDVLNHADELLRRGVSQDQLLVSLTEHFRQLMLISACGAETDLVEVDEATREQLVAQAGQFDAPALVHLIALCENLQRQSRQSAAARALLDAGLARMALSEQFADVAALLGQGGEAGRSAGVSASRSRAALPAGTQKKKEPPPPAPAGEVSRPAPTRQASSSSQSPDQPDTGAPADTSDSAGLWRTMLSDAADNPSLGWLKSLEMGSVEGAQVRLRIRPGARSMQAFIHSRSGQLAEMFTRQLQRPVRVTIEEPTGQPSADESAAASPVRRPRRMTQAERDQALSMPIVRQVVDLFDATVVDLRRHGGRYDQDDRADDQ